MTCLISLLGSELSFFFFMDKTNIVVIGAGVTGLTTALLLKQKGYKHVIIVAKYIPGDMNIEYTSPYAGK